MTKLYDYWEKNRVVKPYTIKDKIGFYIVDKCLGWHYSYVLGHKSLMSQVFTYREAWNDSKKNHGATLKELHQYIIKHGELKDD